MTYARKMAVSVFMSLHGAGPPPAEKVVLRIAARIEEVIERCAKEAEIWCKDEGCEDPAHEWSKRAADRIRALATTPAPEPGDRRER